MIVRSSYFVLRRMLREYISLMLLVILPVCLIVIFSLLVRDATDNQLGIPVINSISVVVLLSVQLFGGFYTMEYIKSDLFSPIKWRLYSLPYPAHIHAYSILLSTTIFSALQGFIIVLFTKWVYGVNWGNLGIVIMALLVISFLSQLVLLTFTLGVQNYKNAERLGYVYGFGSALLAGVWFQLPNIGILNFMGTYGNPLSLGRNIMLGLMVGNSLDKVVISFGILIAASIVMVVIATLLGRRKLA